MKKLFFASFITLGIAAVISQVTIIRELMISFYGNELFISLSLAGWLFLVALGALLGSKLKAKFYLWTIFLSPFILLGEILIIRLTRSIEATPGITPDLLFGLFYTLLTIGPLCLILGSQFSLGNKYWMKDKIDSHLINQAYLLENFGFIIGGLLFHFLFVKADEILIVLFIALLNFFIFGQLMFFGRVKGKIIFIGGFVVFLLILGFFSTKINFLTKGWCFPEQKLILSQNSRYGNIAVTLTSNQYNFYENGLNAGNNSINLDEEILIHFPLLFAKNPQNILLIGNGLQNAIPEILKHPVEKVYYLEIDPDLIRLALPYLALETKTSFLDKRVEIIHQDAQRFLKTAKNQFDVIIVNLGNPSTLSLNRYFTKEFFQTAKNHLAEKGIFATYLNSSPNYLNEENKQLIHSIYQTLKTAFNKVLILPEENIYFLASDNNIGYQPQPLIDEYKTRNLENKIVIPEYIVYRLTNDRIIQTLENFSQTSAKINQDLSPKAYWLQNLFWLSQFRPDLADFFLKLTKIKITYWLIILLLLFTTTIGFFLKKKKQNILPLTGMIPDFTLFTLEIILLLLFQTYYGYVYSHIALIIALFMLGMAIGNIWGIKMTQWLKISCRHLRYIYLGIAIYCLLLPYMLNLATKASPIIGAYFIFPLIILIIGVLNGLEFPLTNHLYLESQTKKISAIYSADQLGAAIGALLASLILLPIMGVIKTIIFLALINIFAIIILSFSKIIPKYPE